MLAAQVALHLAVRRLASEPLNDILPAVLILSTVNLFVLRSTSSWYLHLGSHWEQATISAGMRCVKYVVLSDRVSRPDHVACGDMGLPPKYHAPVTVNLMCQVAL